MITYEIIVDVAPKLVETYESFMRQEHIPDVLATGCFQQASFTRSDRGRYRIRYEVGTAEMLESYLAAHAPRLRDAFAVPERSGRPFRAGTRRRRPPAEPHRPIR